MPLPIGLLAHNGYDRPRSCNLRLKRPLLCHLSYIPAGYTCCISAPDETRTRMESKFRQIKSLVPYQLGDGCIRSNLDNCLHNCFRFMIISPHLSMFLIPRTRIELGSTGYEPAVLAAILSWSNYKIYDFT